MTILNHIIKPRIFVLMFCAFSVALPTVLLAETKEIGSIQPTLERLLSENSSISQRHRDILKIVIDQYLPECPANQFKIDRIEDVLQIKNQPDGSFMVSSQITCDKKKDSPQMKYAGEFIVVNSDGSLRGRNDAYQPSSDLPDLIAAARARQQSDEKKAPTDVEIRQKQIDYISSMLKNESSISKPHKAIYLRIIKEYSPSCPDYTHDNKKSVKEIVWLRELNDGYVTVLLVACGWKDAQAFRLDSEGNITSKFSLPLGKYGFSPKPELKVADFTGDGQLEFFYKKTFPISSVPAFGTQTQIYKFNKSSQKMVNIFDMETETQNCFEAYREKGRDGDRKFVTLDFGKSEGKIVVGKQVEKMNCDDFSWGKKPVRTNSVSSKRSISYRWSAKEFRYIEDTFQPKLK